jgi:hypothetical protein
MPDGLIRQRKKKKGEKRKKECEKEIKRRGERNRLKK